MKIFKKINLALVAVVIAFTSCVDENPTSPVDPSYKPKATITASSDESSVNESTNLVITYDVTIDKVIKKGIRYSITQTGGTAVEGEDFIVENSSINAFETSTQLKLTILNDLTPEETEDLSFVVGTVNSGNSTWWNAEDNGNLVDPASDTLSKSINIGNRTSNNLTAYLNWDAALASDFDLFVFDPDGNDFALIATGDIPEVNDIIPADAADGEYLIGVDPYAVEAGTTNLMFDWKFSQPDGSVVFLNQNFDYENRSTVYTIKEYTAWTTDSYLMLKVTKTGSSFTVAEY